MQLAVYLALARELARRCKYAVQTIGAAVTVNRDQSQQMVISDEVDSLHCVRPMSTK